ncbi:MAG: L,D-transpeptidase [Anaerolineae bacterium]|nr:L,D-transpeptidase [Anaerolineae bacterium]
MLFLLEVGSLEPAKLVYDPTVCSGRVGDGALSQECVAMINAFPEPPVEEIAPDLSTLSTYSFWRIGPEATNLFDAPGGNVVGQYPAGFNFVRALDTSIEDWLQIEGGHWLARTVAEFTEPSYFRGVRLPYGLDHPFAWVLDKTGIYTSEYPGGPPSPATGRVPLRYERVNIFAEAPGDDGWIWYMIGPDQWVNQRYLSIAQQITRPRNVAGRWAAVDLFEQNLVAYEEDKPIFATLISSGLPGTDTNQDLFTIWARLERDGMSGATGAPNAYALQSVPWVQYFDEAISLHGTYWHDLFGYRQSRGCVNMSISDARFIFEWMGSAGPDPEVEKVNYVYVHSSGDYR